MKVLGKILDMLLLLALFLIWLQLYNKKCEKEGPPTWECPICHKTTTVLSTHYYDDCRDILRDVLESCK